MAEVTVVRSDTDELVDVMLPFEAEFPLNRRPRGVRHGSRIGAWYFDRETGTLALHGDFTQCAQNAAQHETI